MSRSDQEAPTVEPLAEGVTINGLLRRLVEDQASDLHLKAMRPPLMRINGRLIPIESPPLTPEAIAKMVESIIPDRLRDRLDDSMALDFGYGLPGVSRFRASVYHQRGTRAAVFRRVPFDFPSLDDWGLPPILTSFCDLPQGLVLITGPTGSGKSSTLAAMMQQIANTRPDHIVTIEDPIEFLISDKVSSVSQREVGIDTPSFSAALRSVLRQDPDVIMVGEMRDEETIRTVLTAAETGHCVLSTLHTNSAVQTIDRIVSAFPETNHRQVRQQLSACLEAVASLQLVPRADGSGMVAAVEIFRSTPQIAKVILSGDLEALGEAIESSVVFHKMQTMNQSLASLVIHGTITKETAMAVSANAVELDLLFRKVVGSLDDAADPEGSSMGNVTSDFSKILELQEIKKLYDELQGRHGDELAERDRIIAQLREEVARTDNREDESRASQLESENQRLTDQIRTRREEYEAKIERLNSRIRDVSKKSARAAATPPAEPQGGKRGGFFRR